MSSSVLPSLAGLGFDVVRTPVWDTEIQTAISGKETRIAYFTYPRWKWDLTYNVLRSSAAFTELQQLAGFFNARQGMFDAFLYQDADDNSVTAQTISTGDGATTAFQLIRAFGGFIEPILAPNALSAVYLSGVSIPTAGYSAPTTGALTSTASGSLAGATYFVKTTWVTNSGETLPSGETSLAVAASHVLNIAHPTGSAPAGAFGWNAYVSTTTGTETKQNASPIAVGSSWVEPNTGLIAGSALPGANTTGWSFTQWGNATPGVLTFAGAPGSGIAITADFTYYWPCRMTDDSLPFNMFLSQYYAAKKFAFQSVKN
jgi:uncharacterized protein (TIGR02217 family)